MERSEECLAQTFVLEVSQPLMNPTEVHQANLWVMRIGAKLY